MKCEIEFWGTTLACSCPPISDLQSQVAAGCSPEQLAWGQRDQDVVDVQAEAY